MKIGRITFGNDSIKNLKKKINQLTGVDYMRVYIAGPYTSDSAISVFENMRNGIRASLKILLAGHAPFCPWLHYQFFLFLRDKEKISYDAIRNYSIAWLDVSDAMIVLEGWENSKGTLAEIDRARELGIIIYHGVDAFLARNG